MGDASNPLKGADIRDGEGVDDEKNKRRGKRRQKSVIVQAQKSLSAHLHEMIIRCCPQKKVVNNRKSYDVKKIFWDADGNLRQGLSDRVREEELLHILERDCGDDSDPNQVWMIIPSRWIRNWLLFAHLKLASEPPGPIDIGSLIKKDDSESNPDPSGWRPIKTLTPPTRTKIDTGDYSKPEFDVKPGQYRRIPRDVWDQLVDMYGLTEPQYCIAVKGNTPETPSSDLSRWRIFTDPHEVDESALPEPKVRDAAEVKKEIEHKRRLFAALGMS